MRALYTGFKLGVYLGGAVIGFGTVIIGLAAIGTFVKYATKEEKKNEGREKNTDNSDSSVDPFDSTADDSFTI